MTLFAFTFIYSVFPGSECEHTNRLIISVQFRSFLLSGETGKTFIWILQKYTDSVTETTHLAGYNILVFKYVKISAGLPLLFIGAIREKAQNQILHNLAMFTSNVLNNKCFRKMKHARLRKNVILWAISWREISPLVVIFKKKLTKLRVGLLDVTTNIYLKSSGYHPDSECRTFFDRNLSDAKSS